MANVTTFATLKSELLAILGRAPADPVYQMVTKEINRALRVKEMEKTLTVVETSEINLAPTISGATQANPCVITATAHGLATGAQVKIADVVGMTELNGNIYTITRVDADSFSLDSTDSTAFTAYTSGGIAAISPDFLAIHSIYRDTSSRTALRPTSAQAIHRTHVTSGIPEEYAILGYGTETKILLNPAPNGSENLQIRYYGALELLAANDDTNDVLATFPDIYIYGSLFHHGSMVGDPRTPVWEATYNRVFPQRLASATAMSQADLYSGGPLRPSPLVTP